MARTERLIDRYERLIHLYSLTGLMHHYTKAVELLTEIIKSDDKDTKKPIESY